MQDAGGPSAAGMSSLCDLREIWLIAEEMLSDKVLPMAASFLVVESVEIGSRTVSDSFGTPLGNSVPGE